MKKLGVLSLGLTYAGCFLGAGYVSGQELLQFFGVYGIRGIYGLVISVLIQLLFGVLLIRLVHMTGTEDLDKVVIRNNIPLLRRIISIGSIFFMYGILIIMSAGAGSLLNTMCSMPEYIGCGIFCIIIAYMTFKGTDGMISVFSWFVPLLVIGTVLVGIYSIFDNTATNISITQSDNHNMLLGNWFFSSITYVSYNLFGTIGIISPLACRIEKKTVIPGIVCGCVCLFVIAICILLAMFSHTEIIDAQLPMLQLACSINIIIGWFYALLMLFGMFGTSLSSLVAVINFSEHRFDWVSKRKGFTIIALTVIAWIGSFAGFGELIGIVYPISGYFGFFVIICVLGNYYLTSKEKSVNKPVNENKEI